MNKFRVYWFVSMINDKIFEITRLNKAMVVLGKYQQLVIANIISGEELNVTELWYDEYYHRIENNCIDLTDEELMYVRLMQ